jgi:uncharacterized protein (TIGR02246 family)
LANDGALTEPIPDARVHQQPLIADRGELHVPKANKEILEQANAAIAQGDFEGFLALCTEDTVWTFEGDRTLRGKSAVRQWMRTAYEEPPKFQVHRMIAEGDFVAALGEITLKDEQEKPVQHAYCDVWRFREGKMAELQAFVVKRKVP